MGEVAVALGVDALQALASAGRFGFGNLDGDRSALDADELGRDAHPGVALPGELVREVRVVGAGVDATADVQPLDRDHTVELGGVGRPAHQDARRVVGDRKGPSLVRRGARREIRNAIVRELFVRAAEVVNDNSP